MESRIPPDDDDPFEWTDPPPRPSRAPRERPESGEPQEPVAPTRPQADEGEAEDPLATGERRAVAEPRPRPGRRSDTEETRRVRGDTGDFERGGRRPPPGRRERHRDLPARVRRRQAFGAGAIAIVAIIVLIVAISGGSEKKTEPQIGLKRLIGQTLVGKVKGTPSQGLIKRVRQGQVGSVIVFPKNAQTLRPEIQRLQQAARAGKNPALLVMIDQEGGSVKRLPDGPPDVTPQQLGSSGDEGASKDAGQNTGSYLRSLGVNVDLAPVLDVAQPQITDPSIRSRTFGSDPSVVAKVGVAFGEGLQAGGVVATAKHFPGLGRATVSTDQRPVTIAATTDQLQSDLVPFKAAVDAGLRMVMVSTASYPTLGSKKLAALSPSIVKGLLRTQLGFDGVVVTDDLESPAVTSVTTPAAAAASALAAGDDLLLFAKSDGGSERAFNALVTQVKSGKLDRSVVQAAYDRVTQLKESPAA
jgi:beta-N-acetylhexosaminidase